MPIRATQATLVAIVFAAIPPGLAACGGGGGDGAGGAAEGPRVVATTTYAADLARNVAGNRAEVSSMIPASADPHDYEPRPSAAEALAGADLVVRSGGEVDAWVDQLASAAGSDAEQLDLSAPVGLDEGDPHWWLDPRRASVAVEALRDRLVAIDPEGAAGYRRAANAYLRRLRELDRSIESCVGRLRADERALVSEHDSLGYYADRYGLEVVGAAIPGGSTQAQPSAGGTAALVEQIRDRGVRAVFPEAGFEPRLQRAIAAEAGVEIGGELWTDGLGPPGSGAATYLDAMRANTDAIVGGLSGGRVRCF